MRKYIEGEWHVFRQRTTKPFERLKIDATRGLMQGFSGLFTTHRWEGFTCHVSGPGAESTVEFDHGEIIVRVRTHSLVGNLFQKKILSDIENLTSDVAEAMSSANKDIFIVHGHDHARRDELKNLLESLGLRPIILEQCDDRGLTIIEKFEYYASASSFAFILMTPDDPAQSGNDVDSRWRARQNVIMELGWFIARLGRERVVILYKDELEIPSDILGVVLIQFNDSVYEVAEKIRKRLKGVGLVE